MLRRTGTLLALLGAGVAFGTASAQDTVKTKELTARELFYTAVPAQAAAAKPAGVKPPSKPVSQASTAKAERKPASRHTSATVVETAKSAPATAATPDGTPVIAAAVRRTAPPPTSGPPLGLRYMITKMVDGKMVEVASDSTFQAGDRIRITVVPNAPGYLYIISQGSSGTWKPMFPSPEVEDGNNRVEGFRDYVLPPKSRMVFDSQAGVERLFVVLSREPEKDLEQMIYSLQSPAKTAPVSEPAAPVEAAPKTLLAVNISNDLVGRMRNVYARDLVIERVDEETPGDRREKAVYVVNPTGSADSRVVADIALAHQ